MKHFKYKKCFCFFFFKQMLQISISIRNPAVWQGESNPAPTAVKTPDDFSGRRVRHKGGAYLNKVCTHESQNGKDMRYDQMRRF